MAVVAAPAVAVEATTLDGFEATTPWTASASDGVSAHLAAVAGATGHALRLNYDFAQVSGYAFVRRTLPIDWPADFEMTLKVRGTGGVNDLQIKFVDASGTNVWWYRRANFRASAEWQTVRIRPRDLSFAWGPSVDRTLRRTQTMEIVLARGRDGGAGDLEVDDLTLTTLPPPRPLPPVHASDPRATDGDRATAWVARGGDALTLDFGGRKALGGLMLDWAPGAAATRYAIDVSDDGRTWRRVREVTAGDGGSDPIALADTETRYLRIVLPSGAAPARLSELAVEPPAFAETPNAFIAALANTSSRGSYPRGFSGEQPYWTLVGTDGGTQSGLIGEDGAIEVAKGGFSIEPFVVADGHVFTWADVTSRQSLKDGYLPMPQVTWSSPGWTLATMLFADTRAPRLMAAWRLTNTGATRRTLRLLLAVRPFQVNPPAQFLSQQGGVSPISAITWNGERLAVTSPPVIDGDAATMRTVRPVVRPTAVTARPLDQGALMITPTPTGASSARDPTGLASATLAYDLTLAPGESRDIPVVLPFAGEGYAVDHAAFDTARETTAQDWRRKLGHVIITVPPAKQPIADTVRTALAHILISRDGPALKPGTRSYDRSWIRDGAMMSDTLLRLGVTSPARAFADWYGTKLFANGKVPCCVDARGADPVPENDAPGEYIHLVTQLYRFTHDHAALTRDCPRLDAARRFMDTRRLSERTPANRSGDGALGYGLMPPSISHEGYSAQAQYSLWDDFWAITGYKDATFASRALGKPEADEIDQARKQFVGDVHAAISAAAARWRIDYIPGATSVGDFDATSTTIALDPAGEQDALDPALLRHTFERQWDRVTARTAAGADWSDYTPYELRNVSAFIRLGWRARANRLLDGYMADRRPAAWNGWAEVVGRRPREVRFIGDMPHAWVASDFIRAALDMFAYARAPDEAIVIAAGLDAGWLTGAGSSVRGLVTPYGSLGVSVSGSAERLRVHLAGTAKPPGGFVIPLPNAGLAATATVDGSPTSTTNGAVVIAADGKSHSVVIQTQRGTPIRLPRSR